jgi:hypothetical protein
MPSRICKICNKKFPKKHSSIYCSDKCRQEGRKLSSNKYNKSDKKKIIQARYRKSEKGKIAIKKFKETGYNQEYAKKYYLKDPEKFKTRSNKRYNEKREIINEQRKKYYYSLTPEKKQKKNDLNRRWKKTSAGMAYGRYDASLRRKRIRQATPKWEDAEKTKYIYDVAVKLQEIINTPVHVDHIIPIKGITFEDNAKVCGLNVYYNMMPVLEADNESKKNYCLPAKQIKDIKIPHLSLDKLTQPKNWIKFIDTMYKNVIKSNHHKNFEKQVLSNYLELNPRRLKN